MRTSFEGISTDIAVGNVRADLPLVMGTGNVGFQIVQSPAVKGVPAHGENSHAGLINTHMSLEPYDVMVGAQYRAATQEEYAEQGISERVITAPILRSAGIDTVERLRDIEKAGIFGKVRIIKESYYEDVELPAENV